MKQIIDALEEKACSKRELLDILQKQYPNKNSEAIRKRCERSLEKLERWGLVEKRGDKYCWRIYVNDYANQGSYDAKLMHSQKLVPALKRIAGIYADCYSVGDPFRFESAEDARIRDECAKAHLACYPDVWSLFDDFDTQRVDAEKERIKLCSRLKQKLAETFGETRVQPKRKGKSTSYVSEKLPSLIYARMLGKEQPVKTKMEADGMIWLDGILIAQGKQLNFRVKKFVRDAVRDKSNIGAVSRILAAEKKASEARVKLEEKVRQLIMRIEAGEPLLGRCDTCPKFSIRAGTTSK
jgi:hypothetical protein